MSANEHSGDAPLIKRHCESCLIHWTGMATDPCPSSRCDTNRTASPEVVALESCEILHAERDGALDDLLAMVRIIRRVGGFMWPEDQAALFAAESRIVASGRKVER